MHLWKLPCIFGNVEQQNYFAEQLLLQQILSILNHWNSYHGLPEAQISWFNLLLFIVIFIVIHIFNIVMQIECGVNYEWILHCKLLIEEQ